MGNRREFIGQVGWALPLATGFPMRALGEGPAAPAFHSVLIDDRHSAARDFGERFSAQGAKVSRVAGGEITDLWLREIRPAWQRRPVPIAGLTERAALFCLEQLAWAQGLRVVFHAEHFLEAGHADHDVHRCGGGRPLVDRQQLKLAGSNWSGRVADAVAGFSVRSRAKAVGPSCAGLEPAMSSGANLLTTWIIAPV